MAQIVYLDSIPVKIGSAVAACSLASTISYLKEEIFSEGSYRRNVPWWAFLPKGESGNQSFEWVADQLTAMEQLRKDNINPYMIDVNGNPFDIGLLDIQVFMDVENEENAARLLQSSSNELLQHNGIHLDLLVETALHDQMVMLQTLHIFNTRGSLRLHYHNIALGLRRQGELVGFLDMTPLLNALSPKTNIGFIV